jgi:acyl-CoA thioesterase FadM
VLDEVMAWSLAGADNWGVTARMSIAFRKPASLDTPLRAEGWVTRARRRLVDTAARVVDQATGEELATAEGTYLAADETRKAALRRRYGFRGPIDGAQTTPPDSVDKVGPA